MKRTNKKGFTIVELVIVIAVIAILAAVLIPTFTSLVKKANLSADQQAVRQMDTALAMYEAENGKPKSLIEAKKALDKALVNVEGGLVPITQGYAFYWNSTNNRIELVGNVNDVKEGWLLLSNNGLGTVTTISGDNAATAIANAITASSHKNPAIITLNGNVNLGEADQIIVGADKAVVIDLNGKTLTSTYYSSDPNGAIEVADGASLEIKNGSLNLSKAYYGVTNIKATLVLNNVEITGEFTGSAIRYYGFSDTSVVDCKITATADLSYGLDSNSKDPEADGSRVVIEGSTITADGTALFCSVNANVVANNSTFVANGETVYTCAVVFKDGSHQLNNCEFVTPEGKQHIRLEKGAIPGYSGKINAEFNGCEFFIDSENSTAIIAYAELSAKATVTIDSEYTLKKVVDSTGSLTINGTAITLD